MNRNVIDHHGSAGGASPNKHQEVAVGDRRVQRRALTKQQQHSHGPSKNRAAMVQALKQNHSSKVMEEEEAKKKRQSATANKKKQQPPPPIRASMDIALQLLQGQGLAAKDSFTLMGENTSSDPYVIATLVTISQKSKELQIGTTKTCLATLNPFWNETLTASYPAGTFDTNEFYLKLAIWDYDFMKTDDLMGIITIPLKVENYSTGKTTWITVPKDSANGAKGKIELAIETKVHYSVDSFLPSTLAAKGEKEEELLGQHEEEDSETAIIDDLVNLGAEAANAVLGFGSAAATTIIDGSLSAAATAVVGAVSSNNAVSADQEPEDEEEEYENIYGGTEKKVLRINVTAHCGDGLVAQDRNLLGQMVSSDPYVCAELWPLGIPPDEEQDKVNNSLLQFPKILLGRSPCIRKNLSPVWEYTFDTYSLSMDNNNNNLPSMIDMEEAQIRLRIMDDDFGIGSDDPMGNVDIYLRPKEHLQITKKWYHVSSTSSGTGIKATGRILVSLDSHPTTEREVIGVKKKTKKKIENQPTTSTSAALLLSSPKKVGGATSQEEQPATTPSSPELELLSEEFQKELTALVNPTAELELLAEYLQKGLIEQGLVKDQRNRGLGNKKIIHKSFSGKDVVDTLLKLMTMTDATTSETATREEAMVKGNEIMTRFTFFKHATNDNKPLLDSANQLYRFHNNLPRQVERVQQQHNNFNKSSPRDQVRLLEQHIVCKNHRYMMREYPNCFVASEAVDVMMDLQLVVSRPEAVQQMQYLIDKVSCCEHVTKEHEFKDEYLFFHFVPLQDRAPDPREDGRSRSNRGKSRTTTRRSEEEDPEMAASMPARISHSSGDHHQESSIRRSRRSHRTKGRSMRSSETDGHSSRRQMGGSSSRHEMGGSSRRDRTGSSSRREMHHQQSSRASRRHTSTHVDSNHRESRKTSRSRRSTRAHARSSAEPDRSKSPTDKESRRREEDSSRRRERMSKLERSGDLEGTTRSRSVRERKSKSDVPSGEGEVSTRSRSVREKRRSKSERRRSDKAEGSARSTSTRGESAQEDEREVSTRSRSVREKRRSKSERRQSDIAEDSARSRSIRGESREEDERKRHRTSTRGKSSRDAGGRRRSSAHREKDHSRRIRSDSVPASGQPRDRERSNRLNRSKNDMSESARTLGESSHHRDKSRSHRRHGERSSRSGTDKDHQRRAKSFSQRDRQPSERKKALDGSRHGSPKKALSKEKRDPGESPKQSKDYSGIMNTFGLTGSKQEREPQKDATHEEGNADQDVPHSAKKYGGVMKGFGAITQSMNKKRSKSRE